jgi:hypothetical protein
MLVFLRSYLTYSSFGCFYTLTPEWRNGHGFLLFVVALGDSYVTYKAKLAMNMTRQNRSSIVNMNLLLSMSIVECISEITNGIIF